MTKNGEPLKWFFDHVNDETNECVIWPYANTGQITHRYGFIKNFGETHIMACKIRNGPKPFDEAEAIHSCCHTLCMNYRHLRWGSHSDNMQDRIKDGNHNTVILITFNGNTKSIKEWYEIFKPNIDYHSVTRRIRKGMDAFEAMTLKSQQFKSRKR
jgi:hypothetical protein